MKHKISLIIFLSFIALFISAIYIFTAMMEDLGRGLSGAPDDIYQINSEMRACSWDRYEFDPEKRPRIVITNGTNKKNKDDIVTILNANTIYNVKIYSFDSLKIEFGLDNNAFETRDTYCFGINGYEQILEYDPQNKENCFLHILPLKYIFPEVFRGIEIEYYNIDREINSGLHSPGIIIEKVRERSNDKFDFLSLKNVNRLYNLKQIGNDSLFIDCGYASRKLRFRDSLHVKFTNNFQRFSYDPFDKNKWKMEEFPSK